MFDARVLPHPNLELGATLLNHQGGSGPEVTFSERLQDIFLIYPQGRLISDKVIGAGLRLTVPALRSQLYAEVGTTDDHELFSGADEALTSEAVWIGGARVVGLGREGRFDLWAEGRRAGVRPHTHHQFTSGLTLDRRLIGDALGPLATGLAAGIEWRGVAGLAMLSGAWERYSGADHYDQVSSDGRFAWVRLTDESDEIRVRVTGEWTADLGPRRVTPGVRIAYERVTRFAFTSDARAHLLAQARLDYRW